MERVNAQMDVASIRECLKEFAKQSEKMEMQQEMVSLYCLFRIDQMGDAIDSGLDGVNDEEAASNVYSQICDEIGVEINEEQEVKNNKLAMPQSEAVNY